MNRREHSPGPDRFAEGFAIFISSTIVLGLVDVGRLRLPSFVAKVVAITMIGTALFGLWWGSQGFIDRRYNSE